MTTDQAKKLWRQRFRLSLRTNGMLVFRENWRERVAGFDEDICQISRESNVPLASTVDYTATLQSVVSDAPSIADTFLARSISHSGQTVR